MPYKTFYLPSSSCTYQGIKDFDYLNYFDMNIHVNKQVAFQSSVSFMLGFYNPLRGREWSEAPTATGLHCGPNVGGRARSRIFVNIIQPIGSRVCDDLLSTKR